MKRARSPQPAARSPQPAARSHHPPLSDSSQGIHWHIFATANIQRSAVTEKPRGRRAEGNVHTEQVPSAMSLLPAVGVLLWSITRCAVSGTAWSWSCACRRAAADRHSFTRRASNARSRLLWIHETAAGTATSLVK